MGLNIAVMKGSLAPCQFRLFNPVILGPIQDNLLVMASDHLQAAKMIDRELQKYFSNAPELYYFTLLGEDDQQQYHFKIVQELTSDEVPVISYQIDYLPGMLPDNVTANMLRQFETTFIQYGGKPNLVEDSAENAVIERRLDRMMEILESLRSKKEQKPERYGGRYSALEMDLPISQFVYYHLPYYLIDADDIDPVRRHKLFVPTFYFPVDIEINMGIY